MRSQWLYYMRKKFKQKWISNHDFTKKYLREINCDINVDRESGKKRSNRAESFFEIIVAIYKMSLSPDAYVAVQILHDTIRRCGRYAIVTSIIWLDSGHTVLVILNCSSDNYCVIVRNAVDTCWPFLLVSTVFAQFKLQLKHPIDE